MFPETEKTSHFKNRKESLALDVPKIDTLSFSYSDQTDFRNQSPTPATLTVKLLSLQMTVFTYSRNSGNKRTAVYALPKFRKSCRPAERILQYKGLLPAPLIPHKKIIALSGCPHLFTLYTITTTAISFPAIRKIKIALPFHQVEVSLPKMAYTTI
jgi:hypothetical protein